MHTPTRWTVPDAATPGNTITLAGCDFGAPAREGAPIALLSHANGLCAATWRLTAGLLGRRYHVVALDARGHGDSPLTTPVAEVRWEHFVADLIAVAERLLEAAAQPAIAYGIGSSFGGIVTAAAAASRPDLFRRVAMLDPPVHPTERLLQRLALPLPPEPSARRSELVAQTRRRRRVWPSRAAAGEAWRTKPTFAGWQQAAFDDYLEHGLRDRPDGTVELKCHPDVEAHIFETTGSLDVVDFAPRVTAPLLLARAASGFFPAEVFLPLTDLFPNGTYTEISAGHLLPVEAPEATAAALLGFAGP